MGLFAVLLPANKNIISGRRKTQKKQLKANLGEAT